MKIDLRKVLTPVVLVAEEDGKAITVSPYLTENKEAIAVSGTAAFDPFTGKSLKLIDNNTEEVASDAIETMFVHVATCAHCSSKMLASASLADEMEQASDQEMFCVVCASPVVAEISSALLAPALATEFMSEAADDEDIEDADDPEEEEPEAESESDEEEAGEDDSEAESESDAEEPEAESEEEPEASEEDTGESEEETTDSEEEDAPVEDDDAEEDATETPVAEAPVVEAPVSNAPEVKTSDDVVSLNEIVKVDAKLEAIPNEDATVKHVFVDNEPVGVCKKEAASEGVKKIWDGPQFTTALRQEIMADGNLKEFGFSGYQYTVESGEAIRNAIHKNRMRMEAKVQDDLAKAVRVNSQSLKIAALASMKGTFVDMPNKLRESLVGRFNRTGVENAAALVDAAFAESAAAWLDSVFEKAQTLASKPEEAREEIASFIATASFQTRQASAGDELATKLASEKAPSSVVATAQSRAETASDKRSATVVSRGFRRISSMRFGGGK